MAMTQYSGNVEIITNIGTTPNERGLTTKQFKAKFDEALKAFVTWFNDTHKTEFDALAGNQLNLTLPSTNLEYVGITSTETMAVSCSVGDALYLKSTGYDKAKADADTTLPCCAMCLETGTGSKKVLKVGFIKNTSWNFTVGAQIYVSAATAGAVTATKPETEGNRINPVGVAVAADTIWFNPTPVFVEV